MLKKIFTSNPEYVNLKGYKKETPLHVAAKDSHLEAVKAIFASETKPDVNAQ